MPGRKLWRGLVQNCSAGSSETNHDRTSEWTIVLLHDKTDGGHVTAYAFSQRGRSFRGTCRPLRRNVSNCPPVPRQKRLRPTQYGRGG
ncbi:hypothetical protein BaRGS_00004644, partial [Batillaria attramentaria]